MAPAMSPNPEGKILTAGTTGSPMEITQNRQIRHYSVTSSGPTLQEEQVLEIYKPRARRGALPGRPWSGDQRP